MKGIKLLKSAALVVCLLMFSASTILAQDFCKADFYYDGSVMADDVDIFLAEFGKRTAFQNPCPPDGPSPVAKTGQTSTYDTDYADEDGDLQRGVTWPSPRFKIIYYDASYQLCTNQTSDCDADSETDLVQDNLTGLIWTRDAAKYGPLDWETSLNTVWWYLTNLDDWGFNDWRVPNRFELESLLDLEYFSPALPNTAGTDQWSQGDPFINVQSSGYWTSSTYATGPGSNAWVVFFNDAHVASFAKTSSIIYVWPVRGGR